MDSITIFGLLTGAIIGLYVKYSKYNDKIEKENQFRIYEEKKKNEENAKKLIEEEKRKKERDNFESNQKQFNDLKNKLILEFDKNQDGKIDLISCDDFNKIFKKYQSKIIEIDKSYLQKFVKISFFLNTKNNDIIKLFDELIHLGVVPSDIHEFQKILHSKKWSISYYNERVKTGQQLQELSSIGDLILLEIHTYESVIFHSISMITALLENDLIAFYEIYESFDKLGIFNSSWQNDVSVKLSDIGYKLDELVISIDRMRIKISESLDNLTYTTESSFKELNKSICQQLSNIDSSIDFNNLLTGIQVYQTHKLNKNMKRLN